VLVSSARRTQQTWSLAQNRLSEAWDDAEVVEDPRIYEASVGRLVDLVAETPHDTATVVLVGHNPGLAGLVERLCIDDELRRQTLVKFPTSAVAVLSCDGPVAESVHGDKRFRVSAFAVLRG